MITWRGMACGLALLTGGACSRGDAPKPTEAAKRAKKMAVAAAAQDRVLLQGYIKESEAADARVPSLRRVSAGYLAGDTGVIWFAYFAADTLAVLDETRRLSGRLDENARYLFRDTLLRYVALDRLEPAGSQAPRRLRLAFGLDSVGAVVATSKNVNDAAVPLDSAADLRAIVLRAQALRQRVLTTPRR